MPVSQPSRATLADLPQIVAIYNSTMTSRQTQFETYPKPNRAMIDVVKNKAGQVLASAVSAMMTHALPTTSQRKSAFVCVKTIAARAGAKPCCDICYNKPLNCRLPM